jgi:uncharacterized membrane protein required for colicin V production
MRRFIWPVWNCFAALCAAYVAALFLPKLLPQVRLALQNHEPEVWGAALEGVGFFTMCLCVLLCSLSVFNGKLSTIRRVVLFAIAVFAAGCLLTSIVLMAPEVRQYFWREQAIAASVALLAAAPGALFGIGLLSALWLLPSRVIQRAKSSNE